VVAAAAAVVAVVLGVQVNHLDHQVSALRSHSALVAAEQSAMAAHSTRMVDLTAPAGTPSPDHVLVVLAASGTGFVQVRELATLPADRTYQLWAVIGGKTISLGLLGPDPTLVPFSVAGRAPVLAFAITDEHSGGVVQTAQQPVVAGHVGT
jgi:hypothetical protein